MLNIVKHTWYFGDGETSTEEAPQHTYKVAGYFFPTIVAIDEFGNSYTYILPVQIVVTEQIMIGKTDTCIRVSMDVNQGVGITPFTGAWVWPSPIAASAKAFDNQNRNLSIVIDSKTMKVFRIGVLDVYSDRQGEDEQEITPMIRLPEIISRVGPHDTVRHIETHTFIEAVLSALRPAFAMAIAVFSKGNSIATAKLSNVKNDGDIAFTKNVEARGIQLQLDFATSGWELSTIETHVQEVDHRTSVVLNQIPEKVWQSEWSLPVVWFSRNKPKIQMNRGDGKLWQIQGQAVAISGPDGGSSSAVSGTINGNAPIVSGDFTVSYWIKSDHVFNLGSFQVTVHDGVLAYGTVTQAGFLQTEWTLVTLVHRGTALEIYQNAELMQTVEVGILSIGGASTIGPGNTFDFRLYRNAVSPESLGYYLQEVPDGGMLP